MAALSLNPARKRSWDENESGIMGPACPPQLKRRMPASRQLYKRMLRLGSRSTRAWPLWTVYPELECAWEDLPAPMPTVEEIREGVKRYHAAVERREQACERGYFARKYGRRSGV